MPVKVILDSYFAYTRILFLSMHEYFCEAYIVIMLLFCDLKKNDFEVSHFIALFIKPILTVFADVCFSKMLLIFLYNFQEIFAWAFKSFPFTWEH